ncbi:nucleolar protein 56, partial [Geospiza fortis]|uniref:Nucleolar protein 56 n=1 Tax=Geospiza fortis TaxID=48883 RepID=A0A8N5F0M2_GEOFO
SPALVRGLTAQSAAKAQLGLGHSYSRAKVKFNVHRVDNMIIQSISLLDQLDKDINTFSMRVREWYGYHFPELIKIVPDNSMYCRVAKFIGNRRELSEESLEGLEEIVMDSAKAQAILEASRSSMGMDISPLDLINIESFSRRVISLSDYRKGLQEYLRSKMSQVAPSLSALIGEPKYGLIFHSTFIGRAAAKNKGRISRYLANKCTIASRIDCFSEVPTSVFGDKLREQVEERLAFYETGEPPRKNLEVMKEAVVEANEVVAEVKRRQEKKEKKRKKREKRRLEALAAAAEEAAENSVMETEENDVGAKKKKKKKKQQQPEESEAEPEPEENGVEEEEEEEPLPKKKRKVVVEPEQEEEEEEEKKKKKKKKKKKAVAQDSEEH